MQLSGCVLTTPHAFVYCKGCVTGHNTGTQASAGQEVDGIFDSASSTLASMLEQTVPRRAEHDVLCTQDNSSW